LDESGSPIEYLKRFKNAKKENRENEQTTLENSLLQESVLADTFRQTIFNPAA
jgi:hypothetical protein